MEHVNGTPRDQIALFPEVIEDYVRDDNPVRFLDAFVDSLDMRNLGFEHAIVNETGRPAYDPKDLLKLYLYGYLNRIRSSRLLERETTRNIELLWLLKRLSPDHKTISNFRRTNGTALRGVFKQFVLTCSKLQLFGAELVAIDSTKFKASNARNRVKDPEQLDKSIARISESIGQYLTQLDHHDSAEDSPAGITPLSKEQLQEKIASLQLRKDTLEQARTDLQNSVDKHVSLTDPDCRLMKNDRRIEPAYAVQAAVDAKHSLIVEYELTQDAADNNHLASLAAATKDMLDIETLFVCADAGYYDTIDLKTCEDNGITTYVPTPEQKVSKKTNVPTPGYYREHFVYDEPSDTYRCPQGHTMQFYSTSRKDGRNIRIYRTNSCRDCQVRPQCTTSPRGRYINRWEHEAVLDRLKQRVAHRPEMITRRKAIIEHVFGTIKKIWGYNALLLRRMVNVASEVALMNLTYNIRRVLNIVGIPKLILSLHSA
jgi:transposase